MPITRPTAESLRHANGAAEHVVIDDTDAAGNKLSVVTLRIAIGCWIACAIASRRSHCRSILCRLALLLRIGIMRIRAQAAAIFARTIVDNGFDRARRNRADGGRTTALRESLGCRCAAGMARYCNAALSPKKVSKASGVGSTDTASQGCPPCGTQRPARCPRCPGRALSRQQAQRRRNTRRA